MLTSVSSSSEQVGLVKSKADDIGRHGHVICERLLPSSGYDNVNIHDNINDIKNNINAGN